MRRELALAAGHERAQIGMVVGRAPRGEHLARGDERRRVGIDHLEARARQRVCGRGHGGDDARRAPPPTPHDSDTNSADTNSADTNSADANSADANSADTNGAGVGRATADRLRRATRDDVEHQPDVAHGPRQRPDRLEPVARRTGRRRGHVPVGRYGPARGSQPVNAGTRSRIADRAAVVAPDRKGHEAARDRGRAAAARPARRALPVRGMPGRPEDPVVGAGLQRELRAVRLADQHRARGPQAGDDRGVGRGHMAGEHETAARRRAVRPWPVCPSP